MGNWGWTWEAHSLTSLTYSLIGATTPGDVGSAARALPHTSSKVSRPIEANAGTDAIGPV